MRTEITPAREAAADYLSEILFQAFESVTLESIEQAFGCDTEEAMSILFEMGTANSAIYWGDIDQFDELADILVGDDDPTEHEDEDGNHCLDHNGTYYCTREGSHPGKHIAGDGYEVCAVWP